MNRQLCFPDGFACWCGVLSILSHRSFGHSNSHFCGPDKLDSFYCGVPQVIKLACTDTPAITQEVLMVSSSGHCLWSVSWSCSSLLCRHPGHPENSLPPGPRTWGHPYLCLPPNSGPVPSLCAMCIHLGNCCRFSVDKVFSNTTVITPMLNPSFPALKH